MQVKSKSIMIRINQLTLGNSLKSGSASSSKDTTSQFRKESPFQDKHHLLKKTSTSKIEVYKKCYTNKPDNNNLV